MELQAQNRADNQGSVLRLVHGDGAPLPQDNTAAFSDQAVIERTDPRWIMAAHLQMRIENQLSLHPVRGIENEHTAMVDQCVQRGFSPIHSQVLVQTVERACMRGGLDATAMAELLSVPLPRRQMRVGHRAVVIGLLGAWTIVIAGFVVIASQLATVA